MENTTKKTGRLAWLLPFRSIVFLLVFVTGSSLTGKALGDMSNWWTKVAGIVNCVTIAVIVMLANSAGSSYKELLNIHKGEKLFKRFVLIPLGFFAVGMAGMYLAGLICYGKVMPRASLDLVAPVSVFLAVLNMIFLPVLTALAEEGLYLGCGTGVIKNKVLAIAVPAFFFALQHCFIPALFDWRYMAYRFVSFLPLTVIFCLYFRKKRDPLPIMIGHALLDLATASTILATSTVPGLYEQMGSMM